MTTSPSQEALVAVDFGAISATEERIQDLWCLAHPADRLRKAGYVLYGLSLSELEKKKRCKHCSKVVHKGRGNPKARTQSVKLAPTIAQQIAAGDYPRPSGEQGRASVPAHGRSMSLQVAAAASDISDMMRDTHLDGKDGKDGKGKEAGPPMNCKYHPGRVWTCCRSAVPGTPCKAEQFHTTREYRTGELESNWAYFATPRTEHREHRAAVVLDCEMGTAASGESELIRLSAVDFFTREVLVDSLVWPGVPMAHYNTRYSGVSRQSMEAARRGGGTLPGRAGARKALWRFVGPDTVVVGHSANSDLTSLRWIHYNIVDTLLLEMAIQPPPPEDQQQQRPQSKSGDAAAAADDDDGEEQQPPVVSAQEAPKRDKSKFPGLSLKALAAERLKREIQVRGRGHDSLEDALATRDLLLWHVIHKPEPPVLY